SSYIKLRVGVSAGSTESPEARFHGQGAIYGPGDKNNAWAAFPASRNWRRPVTAGRLSYHLPGPALVVVLQIRGGGVILKVLGADEANNVVDRLRAGGPSIN